MTQYNLINTCLSTLKGSRIDVMTKLRMEKLLSGIRTLLLVDLDQESGDELETLFLHVKEVCSGQSADGVKGLVDRIRKMHNAMTTCPSPTCF